MFALTAIDSVGMMTLGDYVRARRKALGKHLSDIAPHLGIRGSTLSRKELGEQPFYKHELINLARALDVPHEELYEIWESDPTQHIGGSNIDPINLPRAAARWIARNIPRHPPSQSLEHLPQPPRNRGGMSGGGSGEGGDDAEAKGIPLVAEIGPGHVRQLFSSGSDSTMEVEYVQRGGVEALNAYAVRCIGDAMEPEIRDSDVVIFRPQELAELPLVADGTVVHVTLHGAAAAAQGTLEQLMGVWYGGRTSGRLESLNEAFADVVVSVHDIAAMGVLVEFRRVGGRVRVRERRPVVELVRKAALEPMDIWLRKQLASGEVGLEELVGLRVDGIVAGMELSGQRVPAGEREILATTVRKGIAAAVRDGVALMSGARLRLPGRAPAPVPPPPPGGKPKAKKKGT